MIFMWGMLYVICLSIIVLQALSVFKIFRDLFPKVWRYAVIVLLSSDVQFCIQPGEPEQLKP